MSVGTAVPLLALAALLAASLVTSWRDSYVPIPAPPAGEAGAPVARGTPPGDTESQPRPAETPTPVSQDGDAPSEAPATSSTPTPVAAPQASPAAGDAPSPQPGAAVTPTPSTPPALATPTATLPPRSDGVEVSLRMPESRLAVGQRFVLEVRVYARPGREVDAAQVYLDFDPAVLEVLGVQGGGRLPLALQSGFSNSAGMVEYAGGTLGDAADTPFGLVFVEFRALTPTGPGGTRIGFARPEAPRHTKVVQEGVDITGRLGGVVVVVE